MTSNGQQLAEDAARCEAASVHFNPPYVPPALRPPSQQSGWERPFICTVTVEDVPYPNAKRAEAVPRRLGAQLDGTAPDAAAETVVSRWKARLDADREAMVDAERAKWVEAWPAGICYDVCCTFDHRWYVIERLGRFATLDEALAFVAALPPRRLAGDD
jgi:hypothetical protein